MPKRKYCVLCKSMNKDFKCVSLGFFKKKKKSAWWDGRDD